MNKMRKILEFYRTDRVLLTSGGTIYAACSALDPGLAKLLARDLEATNEIIAYLEARLEG